MAFLKSLLELLNYIRNMLREGKPVALGTAEAPFPTAFGVPTDEAQKEQWLADCDEHCKELERQIAAAEKAHGKKP